MMLLKTFIVIVAFISYSPSVVVAMEEEQHNLRGLQDDAAAAHVVNAEDCTKAHCGELHCPPGFAEFYDYKNNPNKCCPSCKKDHKLDCSYVMCFAGPACEPGQVAIQPNPNTCCDWRCIGPLDKKPEDQVVCGDVLCNRGDVCCNESCGICTPPDGACIELYCGPEVEPEPIFVNN